MVASLKIEFVLDLVVSYVTTMENGLLITLILRKVHGDVIIAKIRAIKVDLSFCHGLGFKKVFVKATTYML